MTKTTFELNAVLAVALLSGNTLVLRCSTLDLISNCLGVYSGATRNCHFGGYSPVGLGDRSPSVGSRGEVPWSWSSLQTLFTDFDCRKSQNLEISQNLPSNSSLVCFTEGAKRPIWGLSPLAHDWHRYWVCISAAMRSSQFRRLVE